MNCSGTGHAPIADTPPAQSPPKQGTTASKTASHIDERTRLASPALSSSSLPTASTATPLPVRHSSDPGDRLAYGNFGGVCYYRWQQIIYRVMDRMDTGETIDDLGVGGVVAPLATPDTQDQLVLRTITSQSGAPTPYGAFEVDYYDAATGTFLPVDDGGTEVYDSATRGLPRAIRVRLRCWDRVGHVRDEDSGERGIEFQETFAIPAGE